MARDLRNLASPVLERPEAIDRNLAQDLIVQSEGKDVVAGSLNARNTHAGPLLPGSGRPPLPQHSNVDDRCDSECPVVDSTVPAPAGTRSTVVAENVVNGTRPIFGYNAIGLQDITEVSATLYVDVNPGKPPAETVLQSAVYLRNQNRKPTALFSVEVVNNSIVLNASESTDPEEKALIYTWKIDNVDRR